MMRWYWIALKRACGGVAVRDGVIVITPPIWRRWRGQRFEHFLAHPRHVLVKPLDDEYGPEQLRLVT